MRRTIAAATLLLLAACAGRAGPVAGPDPSPVRTPQPVWSSTPLPNGMWRTWPASSPARPGVAYAFTLYTHCGLDHSVDFDESLWKSIGPADDGQGNPPAGFNNPFDEGTMTLEAGDVAVFRGAHGGEARFSRFDGPKDIPGCD
jgi:hypothetical protein